MLNSGNQYLRPEYLSPLSTTLDAKKSPLALLALTCSNIGADNPNNKPIIPALEKSKENNASERKDKSPLIVNDEICSKPSFKPYESALKKDDSNNNTTNGEPCGKKTPSSKRSSPLVSHSPVASIKSCGKASPAASDSGSSLAAKSESDNQSFTTSTSSALTCISQNTLSGLGYSASAGLGLDLGRNDSKEPMNTMTTGLNAYKAALSGLNLMSNCCPPSHPIAVDGTMSHSYPASLHSPSALKSTYHPLAASSLSPYVGYARVKTASGGTSLVPVCRDPYCTNCQFSMQAAQMSGCPSGCTQCNHERLAPPSLSYGHSAAFVQGLPGSAAAIAAVGGVPGLQYSSLIPRPNVCSWMIGDMQCGKRFSTSEELLQHLRTHTNFAGNEAHLSFLPPAFSLAPGNYGASCHLHTASSLASSTLRRTYPTSLSPVGSLSAVSRFHPYKGPFTPLQAASVPSLANPGLMYYSPYSLYGQRLGPPVHP